MKDEISLFIRGQPGVQFFLCLHLLPFVHVGHIHARIERTRVWFHAYSLDEWVLEIQVVGILVLKS